MSMPEPLSLSATPAARPRHRLAALAAGALTWAVGGALLWLLDGEVSLAAQAQLLVAVAALAALSLPAWASALAAPLAVVAFNWTFVPPRHSFSVDLRQDAVLLAAVLVVAWTVTFLVARLRAAAAGAAAQAGREAALRGWADTLRNSADPRAHAGHLQATLAAATGLPAGHVALVLLARLDGRADEPEALWLGTPDANQRAGLDLCLRGGQALGPGSGRHEEQPDAYLPLRARGRTVGAALLQGLSGPQHRGARDDTGLRAHLQAQCDLFGEAVHRTLAEHEALALRDEARDQATRNALLAAIAHDHRTPLATILGAASSLQDQADRLDAAQRGRLVGRIIEEAERLARLTQNTLQLARLDGPGVQLGCDWESAEELVGAALQRARRRASGDRLKAWVAPGLPLLWCDAMLLSQLLDNLVDNALKYSPEDQAVEITVRRVADEVVLAVRDRGPGVAPAWRARIFEPFRRGEAQQTADRPGAGVGLAVCRAIAGAHGGTLRLRPRGHGGSAFECVLPVREQPEAPA